MKDGLSDITRLYVARFGRPPEGKKIFIRVQQMKDYSGSVAHTTSAIVPFPDGSGDEQKAP